MVESGIWGIIFQEKISGMNKEFGSHWEVIDLENEYEPVGDPDDIMSVYYALQEDGVDTWSAPDAGSDIEEFIDELNQYLNGDSGCVSYQVVYFFYKSRIDNHFFSTKEECEKYIKRFRFNYNGKNLKPFQIYLFEA